MIAVYLIGGAIVWTRLHVLQLPANQGIAPLSRNYLIIVGVRALAWPVCLSLLVAGLVAGLLRLPAYIASKSSQNSKWPARVTWSIRVLGSVLVIGGLVCLWREQTWQQVIIFGTLGCLVVGAAFLAGTRRLKGAPVSLLAALLMAFVVVIVEAIDIYRLPVKLEYARIAFTNGTRPRQETGFYIGSTSDAVYLAPRYLASKKGCRVRGSIEVLQQRDVARVNLYKAIKVWPRRSQVTGRCKLPPGG